MGGQVTEVVIENYTYLPREVHVHTGDSVRWENREKHTSHSILFAAEGGLDEAAGRREYSPSGAFLGPRRTPRTARARADRVDGQGQLLEADAASLVARRTRHHLPARSLRGLRSFDGADTGELAGGLAKLVGRERADASGGAARAARAR